MGKGEWQANRTVRLWLPADLDCSDVLFVEVSAMTGENTTQPFYLLARAILLAIESGRIDPEQSNSGVSYGERSLRRMSSFGGGASSIRLGPLRAKKLTFGCC